MRRIDVHLFFSFLRRLEPREKVIRLLPGWGGERGGLRGPPSPSSASVRGQLCGHSDLRREFPPQTPLHRPPRVSSLTSFHVCSGSCNQFYPKRRTTSFLNRGGPHCTHESVQFVCSNRIKMHPNYWLNLIRTCLVFADVLQTHSWTARAPVSCPESRTNSSTFNWSHSSSARTTGTLSEPRVFIYSSTV